MCLLRITLGLVTFSVAMALPLLCSKSLRIDSIRKRSPSNASLTSGLTGLETRARPISFCCYCRMSRFVNSVCCSSSPLLCFGDEKMVSLAVLLLKARFVMFWLALVVLMAPELPTLWRELVCRASLLADKFFINLLQL